MAPPPYEPVDDKSGFHALLKGTVIVVVGMLTARLLEYFTRLLLARALDIEELGVLLLAISVIQLCSSLILLGLPIGIARYIAYDKGRGSAENAARIIMSAARFCLPLSILAALFIWMSRDAVLGHFFSAHDLEASAFFVAAALPFVVTAELFLALLRGERAVKRYVLSQDVIGIGSRFLLISALVIVGPDLRSALHVYLVAFVTTAVTAVFFSIEFLPRKAGEYFGPTLLRELIGYSWPLVISTLIKKTGGPVICTLMLGFLFSNDAVGLFGVALTIANLIGMGLLGFRVLFMPTFTELYGAGNLLEAKSMYHSASRWILYAALPATILIFLYSEVILSTFGRAFVDAKAALLVLATGILLNSAIGPTGQMLLAAGYTRLHLLLDVVFVLVNMVASVLLIPRWGILGASLALAGAMLAWNLGSMWLVFRYLRIGPGGGKRLRFTVFSLVTAGSLALVGRMIEGVSDIGMLMIGAVVMALAVLFYIRNLAPSRDREMIQSVLEFRRMAMKRSKA